MFYTYRQTNSGGYWNGPKTIIVEADSKEEADIIAQENGVYFDGVSKGIDCECCGDRWYRTYDGDGVEDLDEGEPSDTSLIVYKN